jgi:hypothetical protein
MEIVKDSEFKLGFYTLEYRIANGYIGKDRINFDLMHKMLQDNNIYKMFGIYSRFYLYALESDFFDENKKKKQFLIEVIIFFYKNYGIENNIYSRILFFMNYLLYDDFKAIDINDILDNIEKDIQNDNNLKNENDHEKLKRNIIKDFDDVIEQMDPFISEYTNKIINNDSKVLFFKLFYNIFIKLELVEDVLDKKYTDTTFNCDFWDKEVDKYIQSISIKKNNEGHLGSKIKMDLMSDLFIFIFYIRKKYKLDPDIIISWWNRGYDKLTVQNIAAGDTKSSSMYLVYLFLLILLLLVIIIVIIVSIKNQNKKSKSKWWF